MSKYGRFSNNAGQSPSHGGYVASPAVAESEQCDMPSFKTTAAAAATATAAAATRRPGHGGYAGSPTVAESDRCDALLPSFKAWFVAVDGFGPQLCDFLAAHVAYFGGGGGGYVEEHAHVYTQLHKEFSQDLERSVDAWLKTHCLREEDLGHMLQLAQRRGDGESDAVMGTLLGLLDYESWIASIFALKQASLGEDATVTAQMQVVPEGATSGQQLQVASPDGQPLQAAGPEGTSGQEFRLSTPLPTSPFAFEPPNREWCHASPEGMV